MANGTTHKTDLPRDLYETLKVQLYTEIEGLIKECEAGHGDKQLLWDMRRVRHELLKSLSASAGVEYPELLEWLTDQDRTVQAPSTRSR
jgi:hypothetical protein